jgi:hypothetical protein
MLVRLLALVALLASGAAAQAMPRGFQTNAPANAMTGGPAMGIGAAQPIQTVQPMNFGVGGTVLPQNFQQPVAGQLTQPVLSTQQATQLIPMDQLQQALNQRVAGLGGITTATPQVAQQPIQLGGIGIAQQQPMQFGNVGIPQMQQQLVTPYGAIPTVQQQPMQLGYGAAVQQPLMTPYGAIPTTQQTVQPIQFAGVQQPIGQFGYGAGIQAQPIGQIGFQQPIGQFGMQQPFVL